MAPDSIFSRAGYFGRCEWALDQGVLTIVPQSLPPEVYTLREISGVGGNAYDVRVRVGDDTLNLTRVGADGAVLLEALHRTWPAHRAAALRLAGAASPSAYAGTWARIAPDGTPVGAPANVRALLYDDALILAADDADLVPLFLATLAEVTVDPVAAAVGARTWQGDTHRFARLGDQTEEFAEQLRANRARLDHEAGRTLGAHLPTLDADRRAALAAVWPPGRLLPLAQAESVAPGCTEALATGWLASLPNSEKAAALLSWGAPDRIYAGYTRAGAGTVSTRASDQGAAADDPQLWILAGKGDHWALDNVSSADHATYRFVGGTEIPGLVEQLVCAPQFSREALTQPLAELVGPRAGDAAAARGLEFLVALRGMLQRDTSSGKGEY